MSGAGTAPGPRLLDPRSTAAVVFGAHDWTEAGLGRAPSFLRSARGIVAYLYDQGGLGLNPDLVLDLFDSGAEAGGQLAEIRDALDTRLRERREAGRPVTDVLVYYVGHGHTDDQGHLSLLVRRSRKGMEAETGIKAPDLARTLRLAAPQQRRIVVLDACFSEAAARDFIGQSGALDQAVASIAANDLGDDQPRRGTLLLCSSPVGKVSMGPPNAARTLFTGAVLDVLRAGAEGKPPALSFADLRDAAYHRMVESFGANAPRPVLHQANAAHGDLTRAPAFPNRDHTRREAPPSSAPPKHGSSPTAPMPAQVAAGAATPPAPISPPSPPARTPQSFSSGPWTALGSVAVFCGIGVALIIIAKSLPPGTALAPEAVPAAVPVPAPQIVAPSRSPGENFQLGQQREREGNDAEATRLYRLAADQGDAGAQYILGWFYEQGLRGLAKDVNEAIRRYQAAARGGNTTARQALARLGQTAVAPAPTPTPSVVAPSRSPEETFRLGLQREREGNYVEAAHLYRLAADQGDARAQYNLGLFYEQGRGGLPRDEREAAHLYRLAADQGDAWAQYNLGLYYEQGRGGLAKDEREAARLYRFAADQNYTWAQYNLGLYYEQGRGGLVQDKAEAVHWYQWAARGGDIAAQQALTRLGRTW